MKYSAQEVMQFVSEEDVKFIRLAFCDVYGVQKNISIMPGELSRAFEQGIAFDASAIGSLGTLKTGDLFIRPDPSTLSVLPWRPDHGRVVRLFGSITYPDGRPFENDTRGLLIKAVKDAEKEGIQFNIGAETEFYLFRLDENGANTSIPYDEAGYMDIAPEDRGENVRREICLTLEQMGIRPESSYHEAGPGQNEIDFCYSDPLSAADNATTFRTVVKTVAHRNGLWADFSPRPLEGKPGNGFYINISAKDANGRARDDLLPHIIAGLIEKTPDITVFLNPTKNSYSRFGKFNAPSCISWAYENRSQLIRVPAASGNYRRAQLRSPDPTANPYLALALVIYSALYGIKNKINPPFPCETDLCQAEVKDAAPLKKLPSSLEEASEIAQKSDFIKKCLPDSLAQKYFVRAK